MASTYSDLKIELMATGEKSGTWGIVTNTNLGTALEEAIVGMANPNFTGDTNLTLTLTDSNATQVARHFVLNVTSGVSLTATRNLVIPQIEKPYIIRNNTTGGQAIQVIGASGTGYTIPNGRTAFVYSDGTNVVQAFDAMLIVPRVVSVASESTITPNIATTDQYQVTALATSATLASPTGTPINGQKLVIRLKDNGTQRSLTWTTGSNGSYRAIGVDLPTTTVANKTYYIGCIYNSTALRWDVVAVAEEF